MLKKKIIRLNSNPKSFAETPDEIDLAMFESTLPIQNSHSYYENDSLGLSIGLWDTTEMIEKSGAYACDEFMVILEGEVEIKNSRTGMKEKVKAGEAFVIPKGFDCQWHQAGYLRKFYMISEHPEEEIPEAPVVENIIKLQSKFLSQRESSSGSLDLSSGRSIDKNIADYKSRCGKFYSGNWSSESFKTDFTMASFNELGYILSGALVLTEENGKQYQFIKNDVFFIPEGVVCKWQSHGFIEVIYAVLER